MWWKTLSIPMNRSSPSANGIAVAVDDLVDAVVGEHVGRHELGQDVLGEAGARAELERDRRSPGVRAMHAA